MQKGIYLKVHANNYFSKEKYFYYLTHLDRADRSI